MDIKGNHGVKNRPPLRGTRGNKSGRSYLEEVGNQEQLQHPVKHLLKNFMASWNTYEYNFATTSQQIFEK